MSSLRTGGSVVAGAAVTFLLPLPVAVAFPLFGWLTGELVGASLPMWVIVVPLLACPLLGGLTTAALRGGEPLRNVAFGGLAGGLGTTAVGTVVGLLLAVVAMGMMPYQGQTVDVSQVLLQMGMYGAAGGVTVGVVLGAVGGAIASLVRTADRTATDDSD